MGKANEGTHDNGEASNFVIRQIAVEVMRNIAIVMLSLCYG